MANHWKRSRITKALTDAARARSFQEAEARLDAVRIAVVVGADQVTTRAGQAAALTAIVTANKCFGRVALVSEVDVSLLARIPLGATLHQVARRLGAKVARTAPARTTHTIAVGAGLDGTGWTVRCWWDRWLSGVRVREEAIGDSRLALSGVFAAALAVRQVFACVLAGKMLRPRDATISLWTPWADTNREDIGPDSFDVPDQFWLLGLGHLGQGFVWNLCLLGSNGGRAIAQDDQNIGEENEATSLLVVSDDIGEKKARIAARWLRAAGWTADLIERRHHGDIRLAPDDPPFLLSGLDRVEPRRVMAKHGFDYMIDAGLGHGPYDFEGIQLRVIAKGSSSDDLWNDREAASGGPRLDRQASAAYQDLERQIGQCGIVSFAEASTSVPFVGAAAGALAIAQAIRLASLEPAVRFLQMQLAAPGMSSASDLVSKPSANLGSNRIRL